MRTTLRALLCSFVATACAPIGEHAGGDHDGPDAGVDGGAASSACDQLETRTMDITISGSAGFTNLPAGCWKLNGKLTLTGPAVTSVAKLGDLREVRDLVIDDTDLTKLDTKSVVEVSGNVTVRYNDKLTDLTNLAVKPVAGAILVAYNAKLATLDLGHATRLEGGVVVQDNALLTKLDLHSLTSTADFTIRNNAALTDLGTLAALHNVHGTLTLDNNDSLVSLANAMMTASTIVDVNVVITGNAKLTELGGLAHMQYVTGTVTANSNSELTMCEIREIDCCVDTGQVLASGNKTTSCNTSGYSWCNQQLGYCPYM